MSLFKIFSISNVEEILIFFEKGNGKAINIEKESRTSIIIFAFISLKDLILLFWIISEASIILMSKIDSPKSF